MRPELAVLLRALALLLLTMPFYAVRRPSFGPDPLASSERGSFLLGSFLRDWFCWILGPVVRVSLAVGLGPLFWNLAGVAFGAAAGFAFACRPERARRLGRSAGRSRGHSRREDRALPSDGLSQGGLP